MNDQQPVTNPLLQRIHIPGETHKLPSGGIFYNNGELSPDVTDGEVHIYPMTALDEIIIKTPDKLFNGQAVVEVFKHCIPEIIKPLELFQKDIDFLMVALRKISYGNEYEITYTHTCENAKEHSYMIDMDQFLTKAKMLDPTTVANQYTVTLDNGQVIKLQPIKFKHIVDMMQQMVTASDTAKELDIIRDNSLTTLLNVIVSVDDITDKTLINEWLETIPVSWTSRIADAIDSVTEWGPTFDTEIICKDCNQPTNIKVPMNPVSFFF